MKKTLIALMALAGVAAAGPLTVQYNEWTETPVLNGDYFAANGKLVFTLGQDFYTWHSGDVLATYWGVDNPSNDTYGSVAITLSGGTDSYTLSIGVGKVTGYGADFTITPDTKVEYASLDHGTLGVRNATFEGVKIERGLTYTLVQSSVLDGNGVATGLAKVELFEAAELVGTVYYAACMNGNASNNPTIKTAVNNGQPSSTVPEPTTATLSLLALAGLAARRRRK